METKETFEYFCLLEKQFWRNFDKKTIEYITFQGELKPEDMLLYGEFGFTLLGLKPALLIEFRDESINKLYIETVAQPAFYAMKTKTLEYHVVQNVKTQESDLHDCVFIYNSQGRMLLEPILHEKVSEISEETMASILDYPGHLPRSEREIPTMKTVIYFHDRIDKKSLIALTSFAIQLSEQEKTVTHFKHYQQVCRDKFGISLKLLIQ
ncbi:MAG: hypothetical protein EXX96DRAFT_544706 [Benjaminiella poitrasii]|nr:MAG: hypothetical protein EXX96DRAFT_544706 [Benjaminiella poitrasii]